MNKQTPKEAFEIETLRVFPMYIYETEGAHSEKKEACLADLKNGFLAVLLQLEICLVPRKIREYP